MVGFNAKGKLAQGQSAAKLLPCVYTENLKSVILLKDGQLLSKSEAAFEVMKDLGGLWGSFSRFFLILPLSVSNFFYQLISRLRYRLWGKREQCRVPTQKERAYFLP